MVLASRCSQEIDVATAFGWTVGGRRFDWERLRRNVAAEVSRLEAAYTNGLLQAGGSVLYDRATPADRGVVRQIGRAHVCTPVPNAHIVFRLLLVNKKQTYDTHSSDRIH